MQTRSSRIGAAIALLSLVAIGCGDNDASTSPGRVDTVTVQLMGPVSVAPGQLAEYRLISLQGGVSRQVTGEAQWSTSDASVIALQGPGLAIGKQTGESMISASYGGQTASLPVFAVPEGTFAVTGAVRERGSTAAIAGAHVQVFSGGALTLETTAGSDGQYRLYGVPPSSSVVVRKDGYLEYQRSLVIGVHTFALDLLLTKLGPPPGPPDQYTGNYDVTLEIGGSCQLPDPVKRRTYTATIDRAGDRYVVTLGGATFVDGCGDNVLVPGLGCHQFILQRVIDDFAVFMADFDWGQGGQISEMLPDGTTLGVVAWSRGRFEGPILWTSGQADVWLFKPPNNTGTSCRTSDLRLLFTRKE